jgi:Family of unknown function (DUF6455)
MGLAEKHKPICIYELMERLGLEPGGGALPRFGLSYASAMRRCERCQTPDACREWLRTAPKTVASAPKFCPSGDILFELQVDQHAHLPTAKPPASRARQSVGRL